jgi:hypothetical protein
VARRRGVSAAFAPQLGARGEIAIEVLPETLSFGLSATYFPARSLETAGAVLQLSEWDPALSLRWTSASRVFVGGELRGGVRRVSVVAELSDSEFGSLATWLPTIGPRLLAGFRSGRYALTLALGADISTYAQAYTVRGAEAASLAQVAPALDLTLGMRL